MDRFYLTWSYIPATFQTFQDFQRRPGFILVPLLCLVFTLVFSVVLIF